MKKLLFLLVFIPIISFGQSFDELMSIDSKEQFVRVMVENGFERTSSDDSQLIYALNPTYDEDGESRASVYVNCLTFENGGAVLLQFYLKNFLGSEVDDNGYERIFSVAKSRCEYDSLIDNVYEEGDEMVQYKCGASGRRIAFSKKDGTGYISYINPTQ